MTIPILVVDADREFAKLIHQKLEATGEYSVQLASSAAAALAAAPGASFRLAVVDFALPDLAGAELIRRLRAQLLGQRGDTINGMLGKQIAQWNFLSGHKGLILEAASLPPHLKLPKSKPIQR